MKEGREGLREEGRERGRGMGRKNININMDESFN